MYYLFLLAKSLASILPRKVCYFFAKALALAHFYISKKDREIVRYNLSVIVKDKRKLDKCVKEVFINFSYYLVDFFRYSRLTKEFLSKYIKVSGTENLDKAVASGKGIICLAAHLGNYELGGAVTAILGYDLNVVALPHKDVRTNRLFDSQRNMVGVKVIPTGAAIKRCLSLLRKGGMVALVADRDFTGHGIKTKVFSRYACLPRGVAFFTLKTDSVIVPCFLVREEKYFYKMIYGETIVYEAKGEDSEEAVIKQYIHVLEKYIKQYPEQWYMFERFWL